MRSPLLKGITTCSRKYSTSVDAAALVRMSVSIFELRLLFGPLFILDPIFSVFWYYWMAF